MSKYDEALKTLELSGGRTVHYYSLADLGIVDVARLPFSLKILLESLVRMQGHPAYEAEHVTAFAARKEAEDDRREFPYMPSRVLLQDFTGVPCVVDLAALRSALKRQGGDPSDIEPQIPVDLVIDHSVQLDMAGCEGALDANLKREFERNNERYVFLRWGQQAFEKLRVLPPGLGICHQVNMEYLATCVATAEDDQGRTIAFPDTCVGTDSHTTMINSMGVMGWGVGGIEAEAAMLGQPIPILTPLVVGFKLTGELPAGVTPTDLALTVVEMLREKGVVGKFVEFYGPGLANLSLADRAPVANMSPEYGATMGFFPVDDATLQYLRETGRSEEQVELVEKYCRAQGLYYTQDTPDPDYGNTIELDMSTVEPSVAGPKRPQDRIVLSEMPAAFDKAQVASTDDRGFALNADALGATGDAGDKGTIEHGSIVIASITSCTNTSNPGLLLGAGIMAKKAVARGLKIPAHVRTSFAPGSRAAADYLAKAGLVESLNALGFNIAAYGCAACIGNSGPLDPNIEKAISDNDLTAATVSSGNRNFEGRIHPMTKANYLCAPPLVLAYALAGNVKVNIATDAIGTDADGKPVTLADIWPTKEEIAEVLALAADPEMYRKVYGDLSNICPEWNALPEITGAVYEWDEASTYIQEPPFFVDFADDAPALADVVDAPVLALLGDFITTDHISPAGTIPTKSPAEKYLFDNKVDRIDFNSFGCRRGNHEVMMRGTFGNIRIRNKMVDQEGGWTVHIPSGETTSIYDAAMKYQAAGETLVIVAGKLYGAGSSRDWAAKGPALLGVKAVIAESLERIHRSNLVEMGVLPLEFLPGETAATYGLTGNEKISISGVADDLQPLKLLDVTATTPEGQTQKFQVKCRIDTPIEIDYYRHGGILDYVLRNITKKD
jgi:aconitate hydratase A / 2-methylisocitrate dehydratase